ncbi:MAG: hypothetical protein J2P57_07620 [Acidimicrobiaceae bacterium]|nr:hypothetical protein [Acidimicrobiaceae bacterium]
MSNDQPYADPRDVEFGKAAKEKEEILDEQRAAGEPGENLEEIEEHEKPPRPGGKAEPAE